MKVFRIVRMVLLLVIVLALPAATALAGFGTATVDGDISEWNLAGDFFAEMHRAGNPALAHESDLYARYDCDNEIMYVLVLQFGSIPLLVEENEAWIAINGISNKVVTDQSVDDGTPPDFAWVGQGYDSNQGHAQGFEASFSLAPGSYSIIAHVNVFDSGGSQTSSTGELDFEVVCDPTAVTVSSLTARAAANPLPFALAAGGVGILAGLAIVWRRRN